MIYFTSDTHFGHMNIIKYCNRPFKTSEEMDTYLINYWNKIIFKDDEVYHLGDFIFKGNCKNIINRLNGKIHLIKGNHDKIKITNFSSQGFESFNYYLIQNIGNFKILFTHEPYTYNEKLRNLFINNNCDFNIHGHLHGNIEGDNNIKADQKERLNRNKTLDISWDVENKIYSINDLLYILEKYNIGSDKDYEKNRW